jgi:hypothetical protein
MSSRFNPNSCCAGLKVVTDGAPRIVVNGTSKVLLASTYIVATRKPPIASAQSRPRQLDDEIVWSFKHLVSAVK